MRVPQSSLADAQSAASRGECTLCRCRGMEGATDGAAAELDATEEGQTCSERRSRGFREAEQRAAAPAAHARPFGFDSKYSIIVCK